MRRREFIVLLGIATTRPLRAVAQQATQIVEFVRNTSPSDSAELVAAFQQGLTKVGYVEKQNVSIEYSLGEQ